METREAIASAIGKIRGQIFDLGLDADKLERNLKGEGQAPPPAPAPACGCGGKGADAAKEAEKLAVELKAAQDKLAVVEKAEAEKAKAARDSLAGELAKKLGAKPEEFAKVGLDELKTIAKALKVDYGMQAPPSEPKRETDEPGTKGSVGSYDYNTKGWR